eukprot:3686338-Heterocapsa_arctica.AAC.1
MLLRDRAACGPVLVFAQQVSGVYIFRLLRHHPAWCGFLKSSRLTARSRLVLLPVPCLRCG